MKKTAGFTLLELMITVAILGILMGAAVPGFSRWLPGYRLKGATQDLYSNLQLAKMGAVRDRIERAVVFDTTNSLYRIVSHGPDRSYNTGDDIIEKTVDFSTYQSGVGYGHGNATQNVPGNAFGDDVSFTGNPKRVTFNSRGMMNGIAGGYVYLRNNKNATYAVGVTGTGIVIMRKWTGTAWE